MRHLATPLLAAVAAATCVACSSTPDAPDELLTARTAVDSLSTEPLAQKFQEDGDRAAQELQAAESMLSQGDLPAVRHRSYLANQYAALVTTQAENERVQERIAESNNRRQSLLLESERAAALESKKRSEALSQELQELKAKQTARGVILTLSDVLFDTGRAGLKPGAARALDKLADYMKGAGATSTFVIEGHTDSRGSNEANLELSLLRAKLVKQALIGRGVGSGRITAEGKGEAFPVASNDTEAGRQQNRRVEIVVSDG